MDKLLNDIVLSQDVVDSLFAMDEGITAACDLKATEICKSLFPNIDLSREENIELVIRPMSSVIALNELLLQNILSFSTIDGVYSSGTIPTRAKIKVLKNFAALNGIVVTSNDLESVYSEIKFGAKNFNLDNKGILYDKLYGTDSDVDRLFFVDSSLKEMIRSDLSYLQIDHLKVMDFERSDFNMGTLIGTSYDRRDYQRYQDYKKSEKVVIPGMLDIYFSTPIEEEIIDVDKDVITGLYNLPEGVYIFVKPTNETKNFVAIEDDIRSNGIVKTSPSLYITDGDSTESILVSKYSNIDFASSINVDELTSTDVMYKGFYPIFVDFTVYSKYDVDSSVIKNSIIEYLASIGGSMSMMSHNDLNDKIRADGNNAVLSSSNVASLFSSLNVGFNNVITFPVSMKDIVIPVELRNASISENTIKVFARSVNVIKE